MFNCDNYKTLCEEIELPEEFTAEVIDFIKDFDFSSVCEHINNLLLPEKAEAAYEALREAEGDRGIKMLAYQLSAALLCRKSYNEKGISNKIFIDTMKCFSRFVKEHKIQFDCYGFDRGWWTWQQLSMSLFRLGVLEFEMRTDEGVNILSVHIPSDSVMTREALGDSYNRAAEFFPKYYKEFKYEGMYCNTWLLAPALKDMLPAGSRILNFMEDYEILSETPDGDSFLMWVYWKEYPNYESLPEDTSLRRAVKKHLLAGGKIGEARGRVKG